MRIEANHILEYDPVNKGYKGLDNKPPQAQPDSPARLPAGNASNLDEAISELNRFFASYHLQFTLHKASGRYQVKLINANTEEVIREWPPDVILEISARFKQVLEEELGILLDTLV